MLHPHIQIHFCPIQKGQRVHLCFKWLTQRAPQHFHSHKTKPIQPKVLHSARALQKHCNHNTNNSTAHPVELLAWGRRHTAVSARHPPRIENYTANYYSKAHHQQRRNGTGKQRVSMTTCDVDDNHKPPSMFIRIHNHHPFNKWTLTSPDQQTDERVAQQALGPNWQMNYFGGSHHAQPQPHTLTL